jgi:hypothetical protein
MSNQVYNDFMGRNYFSKHGGPYFRNDGFSRHDHDHKPGETHEDIEPLPNLFYGFAMALIVVILGIGTALILVN